MPHRFDVPNSISTAVEANLASLNEIVSALVSGLEAGEKPDEAWADLVFKTLREHSWNLGFAFNEELPDAGWHERQARRVYFGKEEEDDVESPD